MALIYPHYGRDAIRKVITGHDQEGFDVEELLSRYEGDRLQKHEVDRIFNVIWRDMETRHAKMIKLDWVQRNGEPQFRDELTIRTTQSDDVVFEHYRQALPANDHPRYIVRTFGGMTRCDDGAWRSDETMESFIIGSAAAFTKHDAIVLAVECIEEQCNTKFQVVGPEGCPIIVKGLRHNEAHYG